MEFGFYFISTCYAHKKLGNLYLKIFKKGVAITK